MKNNLIKNDSVLALDPGKRKFGYAVLLPDGTVRRKGIGETKLLIEVVRGIMAEFAIDTLILGDRTGSKEFRELLIQELKGEPIHVVRVDEDNSSREGRTRYLQKHRHGWRRFLPIGLQSPPEPYDDYVAVILGERYFRKEESGRTEGGCK